MRKAVFITIGLLLFLLYGCGGNASAPVLTSIHQSDSSPSSSNRTIWGIFDIYIDPASDNPVTITPLRTSDFHLNIRKFLEEFPCTDCLDVDDFRPTPDGFEIDVSITHPFGAMAMTGFDVRGIIFFDGSMEFPILATRASSSVNGDACLKNADGYAKLFNPTDYEGDGLFNYSRGRLLPRGMLNPDATLGAFKTYFSDGQSEDDGGRRAFFPGDTIVRTYCIASPTNGPMHLGYAIDTSREPPVVFPPNGLDDFPISANCLEPFRIDVNEINNSLTSRNGAVSLEVVAYDHQDPSHIISCSAEAPGLTDRLIVDDTPEVHIANSVVFSLEIPNETFDADSSGEEILIRILHGDPDPNMGMIFGWAFTVVDVEEMPDSPEIDSIEPNNGLHDTIVDVTISGAGFLPDPIVRLYQGLAVINAFDVSVPDQHTIHCSFYLSEADGFYTLYVENTDGEWGELQNAFEVVPHQSECSNDFHTDTLGSGVLYGIYWLQYDTAFLTKGPYKGMMIATRQGVTGNSLVAIDVDTPEPSDPLPFPDALGNVGSNTIWTLDVDESTGWIFINWLENPSVIDVYSSSGEPVTSVDLGPGCEIRGLDHDGTGGFWVVFKQSLSATRNVQHFTWDPEGDIYVANADDSLEVPSSYEHIQDLAVIPDMRVFILCSADNGTVVFFDISGSTPGTLGQVNHIFPAQMPIAPNSRSGDIEIDQTDPLAAFCRIVAYGRQPAGRSAVVKLDGDLNKPNILSINYHYTSMAINPDTDPLTHHITLYTRETAYGTYHLLETPAGW
jgi:hypothetical protein